MINIITIRFNQILLITFIVLGQLWSSAAQAVPSFARKHDLNCSSCHTAYPQLNATGRKYKENGYQFLTAEANKDIQQISDFLQLEKHAPVSGILVARPFDKKESGLRKLRALHEVELIIAGTLAKDWSGYFELEAEDETGFEPELAPAVLSYRYNTAFNLQFVYGPTFWADSYGILNDHFRLTRGHVGAIDQKFGEADAAGRFRSVRQNIGAHGRLKNRFFYNLNFSGKSADAEGEDPAISSALFNADITRDIMVGAFVVDGEDSDAQRDFTRSGIQFQADMADLRLQGLYVAGNDDRDLADPRGPGEDDNNAYSVQAFYTFRNHSQQPTWVPLIRLDSYEQIDGADSFGEVTFNLSYFFKQNIKAYFEIWDRYDAPSAAAEDTRYTLQLVAGF